MGRFKHLFLAMVAVAGLVLGGCGGDDNITPIVSYNGKFLYVNNNSCVIFGEDLPNYVSGFVIKADGSLESLPGSPFATGGNGTFGTFYGANPIAIARNKKLLFAANRGDDTITSFVMNTRTGELTAVGAPVANGGTMGMGGSMAVDKDENFLFVGNDVTANISVFSIASTGELTPVATSPFAIGTSVDGMTLNSVGSFLYVSAPYANALIVLSVADDGSLTPIAGSPFAYAGGGTITSFALCSSTLGVSISTSELASFSIDATGAPTLVDSVATAGSQAVSTARKGRLAIASSSQLSIISVVQVASDGTLTETVGSPFATTFPSSGYAVATPLATSLYATEGGYIEAFKMDSTGFLTSINTYALTNPGFATGAVIY